MLLRRPIAAVTCCLLTAFAAACSDDPPGGGGKDGDATAEDADTRDGSACPDGFICADADADTAPDTSPEVELDTTPEEEVIVPGTFGAPCNSNADCESGYCVDGPKGYVCTRTCDTTCPSGYDCRSIESGSDVVFLCMPRVRENCAPCAVDFQCHGGLCLELDGSSRCLFPCSEDAECSTGFACLETPREGAPKTCQPTTGSCSCYVEVDGGQRSCTNDNEVGSCQGVSECDPEAGWSSCSAPVAVVEACNGKDDDCDGIWDNDLVGVGAACANVIEGVGSCPGVQLCLGEAGWLCQGPAPALETCNLQDDDCDGTIDEDFKNESGAYVSQENCGGCGVSCTDKIPDAVAFCSGAGASPRCEVESCNPGFFEAGPLTCLPVVDNACVPCLTDTHCTTPGDRCLALDGGNFCGTDCAAGNAHGREAGVCPEGFECRSMSELGVGIRQCVPRSASCTCLAGDEDSERACSKQNDVATCYGVETCDPASGWSACSAKTPLAETCNLADDNCNAVVDDVAGRGDACAITNSNGTCQGSLDCRSGSALVCVAQTPASETCNGKDDDCDGQTDEVTLPLCPKQKGVCAGSTQLCAGQAGLLACNVASYGPKYEESETLCDLLDNDCDGTTDEVDLDGDGHKPTACGGDDCDDRDRLSFEGAFEICGDAADNDCNGVADDRDGDGDGWVAAACGGQDCNDGSSAANPTLAEVCADTLDNDCDGSVNNKDTDNDSYVDIACGGNDCNDARSDTYPGRAETCDGIDNDCNTFIDDKDVDNDGYTDQSCGGVDCDDDKGSVSPGMTEVCGNTVDEDCSGATDDRDLDKDGVRALGCSAGTDCDDLDPQTKPGSPEIWDAKDNDCDPDVDEGVVPVGAVIVTEMLADTVTGGADEPEEYFELTNVAAYAVNLKRWTIWDCGSQASSCTAPDLSSDIVQLAADLVIAPGSTAVFCKRADSASNGGIACNYEFGTQMALGNSGDELIVTQGLVSLGGGVPGTAVHINRVAYPDQDSFDGRARSLRPHFYRGTDNNTDANWCNIVISGSPHQIGTSGNYGTPGRINPGDCSASPPPGVALIAPPNGLSSGGEPVTLFGSGFLSGMSVVIGSSACSAVNVDSSEILTCTTQGNAPGLVSATVTVNAVNSTALANAYTYTTSGSGSFSSVTLAAPLSMTVVAGAVSPLANADVLPAAVGGALVQVGFGAAASDPSTSAGWRWLPAVKTSTSASGDRYSRSLVIASPGTYRYAFRASTDGVTWRYSTTGTVTVTP